MGDPRVGQPSEMIELPRREVEEVDLDPSVEQWAWLEKNGAERAHGPFHTRADAEEHARGYFATDAEFARADVRFGHPVVAEASAYAGQVLKSWQVLEALDEAACDDDFAFADGDVFELIDDEKKADAALRDAIAAWARQYVCSGVWCFKEESAGK